MVDSTCATGRRGSVFDVMDQRKLGSTMNKYWKKLCTPEQNARQIGALKILAGGLTLLFVIWFLGSYL